MLRLDIEAFDFPSTPSEVGGISRKGRSARILPSTLNPQILRAVKGLGFRFGFNRAWVLA